MNAAFLGYATDCRPTAQHKARMGRGFTVMHIYGTDLKYLSITVPPVAEQAAIARFLDHATSRIDRYIRAKEKLFGAAQRQASAADGLLGEYRDRLISDVVTGKLDVREQAAALSNDQDSARTEIPKRRDS